MACANWPNWPTGASSAKNLLLQIIQLAGTLPAAAAAKAAATAGLTATAPKTSANFDCQYYYTWVALALHDAEGGEWDLCGDKLGHLDDN